MQEFEALPIVDKWRIARCLSRGEAPDDPRMAVAAIELAESYRRRGRVYATVTRWLPVVMVVVFSSITIPAAIGGDVEMAILFGLFVLGSIGHLVFNPALRPKNIVRSLEASQQVLTPGS